MKPMRITLASFSASPAGFSNVSLLTGGIEAAGHGIFVDEATIDGAMRALLGKSVRAYLKHDGASGDRLGEEIGFFSGIYRDGLQVKAARFEFLESFKESNKELHAKLVELAAKAPDQFGVSLVLEYAPVWVMSDGTEKAATGSSVPTGALRNVPSMRVKGILSADLVQRPAANPNGLLDAGDNKGTATTTTMSDSKTITVEAHRAEVLTVTAQLGATHTAALDAANADFTAQLEQAGKDSVAALAAKETEHIAALAKQADEYKIALEKLVTEKDAALTAALAEKDGEIAKLGETHKAELEKLAEDHKKALLDAEIAGAAKLGVSPLVLRHATAALSKLPAPAATDRERWDQYTALLSENPEAAATFKATYLSRK